MLPVTHGSEFTRLQILLYTLILFAGCLLPYVYGMSSWIYLIAAIILSIGFCLYGFWLWRDYSDALARKTFRFSLIPPECAVRCLAGGPLRSLNRPIMNKRNALKKIANYSILAGTSGLFVACTDAKPSFAAIDVTGADYAKDFALSDHNGQPRTLKDFAGKVVVMFFGYTQCPDVCPTSMAELAEVKKTLGADGARLQGLFVTVDPERDTPAVLKAYMENFDPTFLALIPTPEQLGPPDQRLQNLLQKGRRQDTHQLHPWTTRREVTCLTPRASCACSPVTAQVPNPWRRTSPSCSSRRDGLHGGRGVSAFVKWWPPALGLSRIMVKVATAITSPMTIHAV